MKNISLIAIFTSFFLLQAQNTINIVSDEELARRDSIWFADNPGTLPIWETLEEKRKRDVKPVTLPSREITDRAQPPAPVRNIAEYEPMEAVLIAYPNKFGIPNSLIKEMAEDVVVYCYTENVQQVEDILQNAGVNMDNVVLLSSQLNSIYTRDFGPWWIVNGDDEIGIVDFEYNRNRPDDNLINGKLGTELGVPVYTMDLVDCGGNYMTDGFGISASTDLIWRENSNYTHNEIDDIMNEYLGIDNYHVVDDPNNTTQIDHIDCWGKFLAPDKILIREVPSSNTDYNDLETTVEYFESQVSSYGTPYEIYRVTSTATNEGYTNSLILNSKVLVPLSETSHDEPALEVYRNAMPGYDVIGFTNDVQSWQNFDALHCRTKGIADRGMLYISHIPLHDTVTSVNGAGYSVEADIIPYSGESLIGDSLLVFYRKENDSNFSLVKMANTSADKYKAVIPQPSTSVEMAYYIHAADQSGRSENHPYIGAPDPHLFFAESQGISINYSSNVYLNFSIKNYPDPFVSQTKIMFNFKSILNSNVLIISIYDNKGRLIREWILNSPASYIIWDGTDKSGQRVSTGVYFCAIKCENMVITKRIQMIR